MFAENQIWINNSGNKVEIIKLNQATVEYRDFSRKGSANEKNGYPKNAFFYSIKSRRDFEELIDGKEEGKIKKESVYQLVFFQFSF